MEEKYKIKQKEEMSVKELKDWINWAEEEMREYRDFADELREELKTREITPKPAKHQLRCIKYIICTQQNN